MVILQAYLKNGELDIKIQCLSYYNKIKLVETGKIFIDDFEVSVTAKVFEDIDGSNIDFKRLLEETFPQLQRITALFTSYGFIKIFLCAFAKASGKNKIEMQVLKIIGVKLKNSTKLNIKFYVKVLNSK